MKTPVLLFCAFLTLCTHSPAAGEEFSSKTVVRVNDNFGRWEGNSASKKEGEQNLLYFSASYAKSRYGITALGTYAKTSYLYNGAGDDFNLATMLDSAVSSFYKIKDAGGFNVRMGLDLNIPTGRAGFSEKELGALFLDNVSRDLTLVTSFGKGLDVSPSIVVSKPGKRIVAGLGIKYTLTGEYDPTTERNNDNYSPGDVIKIIASMQGRLFKNTILLFDADMETSSRDRQSGQDVFKLGNLYDLNLRLIQRYGSVRATYFASYGFQNKNQMLGTGGITTEDRNTNNNSYRLFINLHNQIVKWFGLQAIAGYKKILKNGYDSSSMLYDGGYSKGYFGMGFFFGVSRSLLCTVNLRTFRLFNDQDSWEPVGDTYTGYNVDVGFLYTFGR
ncbi:MAG: hypothetical protein IEMM0002_0494 [bacterium]|nr:MAG: hypothetical protein IEMM0002_0494 [bacterium]